jgi:hypothetical protein
MCNFAHGRNEVSYHPAKYKTRLCNGTECRGEAVCCFAHSDEDLRLWASERYSYLSLVSIGGSSASAGGSLAAMGMGGSSGGMPGGFPGAVQQKHRFCASFPHISQCRRGAACAFAHSREEATTPLLEVEEEEHRPEAMTETFFTEKFKVLWCPIGAQHDWHNCPYAHTYQDARRKPSIGYGPQPCPYWSKKDTRVAYSQRCPLGLRCPYSHGAKEQLYHPKYFRTVICRDLQLKGCPRQTLCAFFHRRQERRSPEPDVVDYTQPLDKDDIPSDWSQYFLSPPFFQESADDSGQGMPPSGSMSMGMSMPSGKGPQPYPGMPMGGSQKGATMGPGGPGSSWYAGYLAGMCNHLGMGPGGVPLPKGRLGDGAGSRTPTTAESDGGLEDVDELEPNQLLMDMGADGMAWLPPGADFQHQQPGFSTRLIPLGGAAPGPMVWGGMPYYGPSSPGPFSRGPPPYVGGYPGYYNGAMGPQDMPEDPWGWGGQ